MADPKHRKDDHIEPDRKITPRDVDPEHRDRVGDRSDSSTAHDRGLRREPIVEEADGGDIGGVAGGGIDSGVSGLGGDKRSR